MVWPSGVSASQTRRGRHQPEFLEAEPSPVVTPHREGYLETGPARPLVWADNGMSATSTVVLRFETRAAQPPPVSTNPAAPDSQFSFSTESDPSQTMVGEFETRSLGSRPATVVETAPPAEPPKPEPPPSRSVLDERFLNWVTRRIDDTKVEIPFQLPTEPSEGEMIAPTERVRVRYREEP